MRKYYQNQFISKTKKFLHLILSLSMKTTNFGKLTKIKI